MTQTPGSYPRSARRKPPRRAASPLWCLGKAPGLPANRAQVSATLETPLRLDPAPQSQRRASPRLEDFQPRYRAPRLPSPRRPRPLVPAPPPSALAQMLATDLKARRAAQRAGRARLPSRAGPAERSGRRRSGSAGAPGGEFSRAPSPGRPPRRGQPDTTTWAAPLPPPTRQPPRPAFFRIFVPPWAPGWGPARR